MPAASFKTMVVPRRRGLGILFKLTGASAGVAPLVLLPERRCRSLLDEFFIKGGVLLCDHPPRVVAFYEFPTGRAEPGS